MAKRSWTRREFLKFSAAGSTALAYNLAGCSSLDSYFMGERRNLDTEVLILGAGAAGLAAAFELKKRKVPFKIFEASPRVGGRVQSVQIFPEGPVAEMGAEFIESSHFRVFELAKELNLPLREVKAAGGLEPHFFSFDERTYRTQDLIPRLRGLQKVLQRVRADLYRNQQVSLTYSNSLQYERSVYYDSLSLKELLESWRSDVDPLILKLIELQAVQRFGADAQDQSSLHFLSTLDSEGSSLLMSQAQYRMEGGLSRLTQNLAARVGGVIPDQVLVLESPLAEISERKGLFQMTFRGPAGEKTLVSKNVICTLPFSKLREVRGIEELRFSAHKKECISKQTYAAHSKGALTFASPFWRQRRGVMPGNLGNFTGDFETQKIWDAGRGQSGKQGLLGYQRAGSAGLTAGSTAGAELRKDLERFYRDLPPSQEEQIVNWSQRVWARGSMAVFRPGDYMRFRGVAVEPEYGGRFLFAGEHTSLRFAGTLQGALESGTLAAIQISSKDPLS